jgi:hypothetical protein
MLPLRESFVILETAAFLSNVFVYQTLVRNEPDFGSGTVRYESNSFPAA